MRHRHDILDIIVACVSLIFILWHDIELVVRVTPHVDFRFLFVPVLIVDVEFFLVIFSRFIELGLGYRYPVIVEGQACSCCCSYSCCACLLHYGPVFDRRITYNDFRNNSYLHFDAGSVPRASGDLLGELYFFYVIPLLCLLCLIFC